MPGNRIKELRHARQIGARVLAKNLGLSQGQLLKVECGERRLTQEWMERISYELRVPAAQLLRTSYAGPENEVVQLGWAAVVDNAELVTAFARYGNLGDCVLRSRRSIPVLRKSETMIAVAIVDGSASRDGADVNVVVDCGDGTPTHNSLFLLAFGNSITVRVFRSTDGPSRYVSRFVPREDDTIDPAEARVVGRVLMAYEDF